MCSQLAQEVVNASLRTPLHRSDNAKVKLSGAFFAHSLRFTSRLGAPRLEQVTLVAITPHREVPAWCCQQVLCACTVAHCFALLRGCIWREADGPSAWSVNVERLPLNYDERHGHEWPHSGFHGQAIRSTQIRGRSLDP